MKRVAFASLCVLSVSVLSVSLVTSRPERAEARGGPKVLCWNKHFPPPTGHGGPEIKRRPKRCTFFKRNESVLAGAVQAFDLHWRHWGSKTARGKGKVQAAMGHKSPVRVKLSKPVSGCGGKVYSKARFHFPKFGTTTRMPLWIRCG